MSQLPSITINCQRTRSDLLQLIVNDRGVALNYISQPDRHVVDQDFLEFAEYPELKELATVTTFDTIWDGDLLWSLATLHEDYAVTSLGHYALHNDNLWATQSLPVGDTQQASVA